MTEYKVKLTKEDVKDFVHAAENCSSDIDIYYNHYVIDAKSILGILSMDLNRILTVRCLDRDAHFENEIRKFAVA